MKRKEQLVQRKSQIIAISLDQFIKKGFYGTSTREIAKIAGISSGLMFHYFENKEKLYHHLIEIGTEKMAFDMKKAEDNPKMYLETVVKTILEQLQSNEFFAKMFVFIDAAQHTSGIPEESRKLLQEIDFYRQCISMIENGQEKGMFKKGNSHALSVAFFGAIQGIAQEKVRVWNTPMPEAEWIMNIIC
jgi:AcrR family transcriptional regulator